MKNFNFKDICHGFEMKLMETKPEILLISGIVTVLAGTISACRKTQKAKEVVEDTKKQIKDIESTLQIDIPENVEIAPETRRQLKIERGRNYIRTYGTALYKFVKLYGIPALLWLGGMGMIVNGHGTLKKRNVALVGDVIAGNELIRQYRERVAKAVGEEVEQKIFHGVQEGMVNVIEIDEKTGDQKIVQKKADVFVTNPGSRFARNFCPDTSDEFDIRYFAEEILDSRVEQINYKLEMGLARAYNAMDIMRILGFNENAFTENNADDDEMMALLLRYGISGNARKVPDPEMRKLKITKLRGYYKTWDVANNCEIYKECIRIDFNFYPLEGKI